VRSIDGNGAFVEWNRVNEYLAIGRKTSHLSTGEKTTNMRNAPRLSEMTMGIYDTLFRPHLQADYLIDGRRESEQ